MVKINEIETDADGMTVEEYLNKNNFDVRRIAVEINGEIITKKVLGTTVFKNGDRVEIVSFVGGG